MRFFLKWLSAPDAFLLYSVSRKVGIGNNGLDPPDKIVRFPREILKCGINISRLPEGGTLDQNNWFRYPSEITLPQYLGNGMIVNPDIAIGKIGLFACR